jgi:hypothetical protein
LIFLVLGASTASAQTTVTATWDRNSDAYTAGYRLYYGTTSGSYQWSVDAGNQVSAPISLSPGSIYYFVVRGYNAEYQHGPASSEATIDLRGSAPTAQITATMQGASTALVSWQTTNAASASINGTTVAASGSTTVPVTSPTTFTLTATAADGRTATASASVTPPPPPPPAPAPTASITATLGANNVATVTWQTANAVSASINGTTVGLSGSTSLAVSAPTTFTITATAADGRTATASASVTPTAPTAPPPTASITATLGANNVATVTWQTANAVSASINGTVVGPSGSTTVTVTATTTFTITAVGASGATATASATVTVAPTGAVPGSPRNLSVFVFSSRATLSWQGPSSGGSPTRYLLYVGTASGRSDIANGYDVGNVLSAYGALPRGTYYARVRAANSAGTSLNSNEVKFTIGKKLRSPTGLTVTWVGKRATLSWAASAADAAEDVPTAYVLEAGTAPGASNVATVNVGNTTSFSTEVGSGNYFVRVRAVNELGESDPSDEIEIHTPGAPQAPSGLVTINGSGPVDLRWNASAGGYGATGYVIEAGSAPGLSDLARLEVGNVTRFVTYAPPGVYYVRVRGLNSTGASLPSNEVVVRR